MGLRRFRDIGKRFDDTNIKNEYRKIYFICEGDHTEPKYFQGLADHAKEIGIKDTIDIIVLKRDENSIGFTTAEQLLKLAEDSILEHKSRGQEFFNPDIDKYVVVFDRDMNGDCSDHFKSHKGNIQIAFSNPCFELWLLLHSPNSVSNIIVPNYDKIFENQKVSDRHTFTSKKVSEVFNMNCKSRLVFSKFQHSICTAIDESKKLECSLHSLSSKMGTNIGVLLEQEFFCSPNV